MADGGIDDRIADDRMAFFDGIAMNGGLGHAACKDRNFFHPP